jgi:hypothetical protein
MCLVKEREKIFKIVSIILVWSLLVSFVFVKEALAARKGAGGGELAEFDSGKWILGTAIGAASSTLGSCLASGMAGESMNFSTSFNNWLTNYSVSTTLSQVNRAVSWYGMDQGWSPKKTLFVSSIVGGVVSGGLNPAQFGKEITTLEGMGLGTVEGTIEGAMIASAANKQGQVPASAGPVAGLVSGIVSNSLATGELDLGRPISRIPSVCLQIKVNKATENMDRGDAYILSQAVGGLYPVIDTVSSMAVSAGAGFTYNLFSGKQKEPQTEGSQTAGATLTTKIIPVIPNNKPGGVDMSMPPISDDNFNKVPGSEKK